MLKAITVAIVITKPKIAITPISNDKLKVVIAFTSGLLYIIFRRPSTA